MKIDRLKNCLYILFVGSTLLLQNCQSGEGISDVNEDLQVSSKGVKKNQKKSLKFLTNTTWNFYFDHDPERGISWNGDVTFYEDGTTRYDEAAAPGKHLEFGTWSLNGDVLTYNMLPEDHAYPDDYVFTAIIGENTFSGTYTYIEDSKNFVATKYSKKHFKDLVTNTTWDFDHDHDPERGISWNGDVTFYEDGTTKYDEPADPGKYLEFGTWTVKGNELTYRRLPVDHAYPDDYVYTGIIIGNHMSGTYTFIDTNHQWTAKKY